MTRTELDRGCPARIARAAAALAILVASAAARGAQAPAPGAWSQRPPLDVAAPPGDATRTALGVVTKVIVRGEGSTHPGNNDCVKLLYSIWNRDGSFRVGAFQRGQPENDCVQAMPPGIAQALEMMVVGERRRVWVPARLMAAGRGHEGPPPADATCDLELVGINKAPPVPPDLRSPPGAAKKMASGLIVHVLKPGSGTQHPTATSHVKVAFSGWTSEGRLFESSVMAHRPAMFEMSAVISGWREALLTMVSGDKARLWIPAPLAYGDKPRRGQPKGALVYDIELLAIDP